jgi:plasmid stabilization system protein ParE
MNIEILSSAEIDLEEGYRFYEKQQIGLGDYFEDSLFSEIESLKLYGGIHRVVFGYHRHIAKKFPYAIYYRMLGETVKVYAVLDCRRNPKELLRKLQRRSNK